MIASTIPKRQFDVRLSRVNDRIVLVRQNNAIEINEIALEIWKLCDGNNDVQKISESLCDIYDVSFEEAFEDCINTIRSLEAFHLIKIL